MNVWIILFISIISIVVFLFLAFFLIKLFFYFKYKNFSNKIEDFLKSEPYIDTLTTLRSVDITLRKKEKNLIEKMMQTSNDEIQEKDKEIAEINHYKEKFAQQQIEIEEKIKSISNLQNKLKEKLSKISPFSVRSIILEIKQLQQQIEKIKEEVNNETSKFIDPIKEFENKRYKYSKIVNNFKNLIQKWETEINDESFSKNLDSKMKLIDTFLHDAIENVDKHNFSESLTNFNLFKKNLYDLILFGNYYDSFKETCLINIKNQFNKVLEYFETTKNEINLNNVDIDFAIKNVETEIEEVKKNFFNLEVEQTEKNIEKVFNSLLNLTFLIKKEVQAYYFFHDEVNQHGYEEIKQFSINVDKKFNEVQLNVNNISHIDKMIYWSFQEDINDLKILLEEINKNIDLYREDFQTGNLSNSMLQNRYEKILQSMLMFFGQINDIEKRIETFYREGYSQGLRYYKLKKIYVNGLSQLRQMGVKLSIEDKEIISLLEKQKKYLEDKIHERNSEEYLKEKVDSFFDLLSKFIMISLKKVVIIKSFYLINNEHSYNRIKNNMYNKKVLESQSLMQDGQYEKGLEVLIQAIMGVNN